MLEAARRYAAYAYVDGVLCVTGYELFILYN